MGNSSCNKSKQSIQRRKNEAKNSDGKLSFFTYGEHITVKANGRTITAHHSS